MRALSAIVILLAGCASTGGDIQGARDSWNGAAYDEVVSHWGAPQRHKTLADGAQAYTWESEGRNDAGPGYSSIAALGGSGGASMGITGALPEHGGSELVRCDRLLVFRNGRVAEQTWQGQPVFCDRFRR